MKSITKKQALDTLIHHGHIFVGTARTAPSELQDQLDRYIADNPIIPIAAKLREATRTSGSTVWFPSLHGGGDSRIDISGKDCVCYLYEGFLSILTSWKSSSGTQHHDSVIYRFIAHEI